VSSRFSSPIAISEFAIFAREFSSVGISRSPFASFAKISGKSDFILEGGDIVENPTEQTYETTLAFGIGGPFNWYSWVTELFENEDRISSSFTLIPATIYKGDEGYKEYGRYQIDYKVVKEDGRIFLRFAQWSKIKDEE
jgi:hypothetical protein